MPLRFGAQGRGMKLRVDGRTVHACSGGRPFDPARPCVVFVHGAVCDHRVFTALARGCASAGHGVLAVDLPGHGRSAGPALGNVAALADWLLALLDAAGLRRAALAGHSMGSLVALHAAARAPERATRLVMLGTCVPMPVPQALLDLAQQDAPAAIERVLRYSFSSPPGGPGGPDTAAPLRDAARVLMHQVLARGGAALLHTDFAACNDDHAGLEAATRVRCPAHLILAEGDRMTPPRAAQALAQALKATVHTVPGGHFLMQESPDATLAALLAALA